MYIPNYNSSLFSLDVAVGFGVDYSSYVVGVLRRKHYGQTRKYRK